MIGTSYGLWCYHLKPHQACGDHMGKHQKHTVVNFQKISLYKFKLKQRVGMFTLRNI